MNCIFCDDREKKFAINLQTGAWKCFHLNKCGAVGSWFDFMKHFNDKPMRLDGQDNFKIPQQRIYKKPDIKSDKVDDRLYDYFLKRKISKDTVKYFKIGIINNAIAFPHFENKEIVFVKYRAFDEKKFWNEKDCKPILFNMDNCKDESILNIVEGHFDVMAAHEYGIKAVSVPNGTADLTWIETCWDFIDRFQKVYLYFDNDPAGQDAAEKIVKRLGEWRCYNVLLPEKDLNDCLIKGVWDEAIKEQIDNAVEYNLTALKKAEHFRNQVKELNKDVLKKYGYEIGFSKLNGFLKGWREGEVTIIHGHNGSGKSTYISQEILFQIGKDFKCCMLSLEMLPKRYLNWMCNQYCKKENLKDEDIDQAFNFMGDKLIIFNRVGEISKEEMFDTFKFAARKYNVKYFILDSLMRVKFDNRYELNEQKNFLDDCKNFAMEYECHFFLIAHPRKGISDNSRPEKSDILGTSNIGNLSDNIIALYRHTKKEFIDSELSIQKNREFGNLGSINLFFDSIQKTFTEEK